MNGCELILNPVLQARRVDKKFLFLLRACNEQQLLAYKLHDKVRDVVSSIKSKFNVLEERPAAVHLLKYFLTQCSDAVFVDNCVPWMMGCIKGANDRSCEADAHDTLRMLLEMSHRFQELTKPIASKVIPKLLEHLLTSYKSRAALHCLQVLLHRYPASCKKSSNDVQEILIKIADEEDEGLVEYAARCFCYLPLAKESGAWTNLQSSLCATANSVMFKLFENQNELMIPAVLSQLEGGFPLRNFKTKDPSLTIHLMTTRLINILTFIKGMLQGGLNSVKEIQADVLVALAFRGLAINCNTLSKGHSVENAALMSVVPNIHVALLNLLETLVSCCSGGLLQFGPVFCKFVVQTLKWTSVSSTYGLERPYRRLREASYKFLESWILRAKASSCAEFLSEEFVSLSLTDVLQRKESVVLQVRSGKHSFDQQVSQIRRHLSDSKANAGPCEFALRALCALVQASGSLLKPSLHVKLQETAVLLLTEIRNSSGPEDMPSPYSVTGCRLQLYRLLAVLTLHPHPSWAPPTQFALSLLPWGQHDQSLEIVDFSTLAMSSIRQMVHPSHSSHQFPMKLSEMRRSADLDCLSSVEQVTTSLSKHLPEEEEMELNDSSVFIPAAAVAELPEENNEITFTGDDLNSSRTTNNYILVKKRSRTPSSKVHVNGTDTNSQTPDSSKCRKKSSTPSNVTPTSEKTLSCNTPPSDKPSKKKRSSQSFVQTFEYTTSRKRNRSVGQDWEVTEIVTNQSENKKKSKNEEKLLTNIPKKIRHESPKDNLNRKESKKQYVQEVISVIDLVGNSEEETVTIGDTTSNEEIIENKQSVSTDANSVDPIVDLADSDVSEDFSLRIDNDGDSSDINNSTTDTTKVTEKISKNKENKIGIILVNEEEKYDVESSGNRSEKVSEKVTNDLAASVCDFISNKRVSPKKASVKRIVESCEDDVEKTPESKKKVSPVEKNGVNVVVDISLSPEPHVGEISMSNKNKSPTKEPSAKAVVELLDTGVEDSAVSNRDMSPLRNNSVEAGVESPEVERADIVSSERISEEKVPPEEVEKSCYAQVASATSNPDDASEKCLKELTLSECEAKEMDSVMVFDAVSVRLKDIAASNTKEFSVQKMKIDGIEEDSGTKEKSLTIHPVGTSAQETKDLTASDREMEETNTGMEAVVDSPDVALEEITASNNEESVEKKLQGDGVEGDSGSDTAEEDVLKSFVDIVSPKST